MPILQINPLPNPIQRGINVDYFDRKALERQTRHDKARALWAEETKAIANQRFDDVAAREQFLKERDAMFNEVVDRNAGNLSRGLHDIVGAVEKASLHQYHNLNKKKMDELARQQALKDKYGAKYIDQSVGLDKSLYDPINGWLDPSNIKASGVEASDYEGTAKNLVDDLAAKVRAGSTDLQLSNDAYSLVSRYIQTKQLTPEMIRALADDPTVQQAFLMNAPTAGIDSREYQQGKTYKDIFSTPQGISDYIYGNARDKVIDQKTSKSQFIANRARLYQDKLTLAKKKLINDKALENYKFNLNRINTDPNYTAPFKNKNLTKESYKLMKERKDILEQQNADNFSEKIKTIATLMPYLPQDDKGSFNPQIYYNPATQTLDTDKIRLTIQSSTKLQGEELNKAVEEATAGLIKIAEINKATFENNLSLNNVNKIDQAIDKEVYNDYYNNILTTKEKELLKANNINNWKDLKAKINDSKFIEEKRREQTYQNAYISPYEELILASADYKQEKINNNEVGLDKTILGIHNDNEKSAINRFTNAIEGPLNSSNKANVMANLTTELDIPLSNDPDMIAKLAQEGEAKTSVTMLSNEGGFTTVGITTSVGEDDKNPVVKVVKIQNNSTFAKYYAQEAARDAIQSNAPQQTKQNSIVYVGQTEYYDQNAAAFGALMTGENVGHTFTKMRTPDGKIVMKPIIIEKAETKNGTIYTAYYQYGLNNDKRHNIAISGNLPEVLNNVEFEQGKNTLNLSSDFKTSLKYTSKANKSNVEKSIFK